MWKKKAKGKKKGRLFRSGGTDPEQGVWDGHGKLVC